MRKSYDPEDIGATQYMDAPCKCDCGRWFDLDDGYNSTEGVVVCNECHKLEEEYDYVIDRLNCLEGIVGVRDERAKLKKRLKELQKL